MDRADLSAALIQELGAVFTAALDEALPALLGSDLAEMEQRVRTLGRAVLGQVITRVIRLHATRGTEERGACPECGGHTRVRGPGAGAAPAGLGRRRYPPPCLLAVRAVRAGPRPARRPVGVGHRRPLAGVGAGGLSRRNRRGMRERGGQRG